MTGPARSVYVIRAHWSGLHSRQAGLRFCVAAGRSPYVTRREVTLQRLLLASCLILCWVFIIAAGISIGQELGIW